MIVEESLDGVDAMGDVVSPTFHRFVRCVRRSSFIPYFRAAAKCDVERLEICEELVLIDLDQERLDEQAATRIRCNDYRRVDKPFVINYRDEVTDIIPPAPTESSAGARSPQLDYAAGRGRRSRVFDDSSQV